MKRLATLLAALVLGAATAQMSLPQESDPYFAQGQETLQRMLELTPDTSQARNVILFVSDGAGPAIITATRIFQGQQLGLLGEEYVLPYETFPYVAATKTYNANAQTPDSAGTSTAMNTGVKTKQGVLGVNQDTLRGICSSAQGREVLTLVEMAEMAGMATGVVSTARITHATPAAAYAHSADRNWEDDDDLTEEAVAAGCTDIASQLVDFPFGDGIDLALGGGRRHFIGAEQADPEDAEETGNRTDGRDLTAEWAEAGGSYVFDLAGFSQLDPADSAPVLGLFNRSHMEYEYDRVNEHPATEEEAAAAAEEAAAAAAAEEAAAAAGEEGAAEGDAAAGEQEAAAGQLQVGPDEPSLAEMTAFAIEKLSSNENGFVLTVESGRVDHAAHAGNAYRMLTDNVEFAEAVQTALDMVDLSETLIIVTADHAHTVTLAGYAERGNPILGLVRGLDGFGLPGDVVTAADEKPYTSIGFANGPGAADIIGQTERPDLTQEQVLDPDFLQQALIPLSSETHGGTDILTYAAGPHAYLMGGVIEQSYLFHVMERALDLRNRAAAGGAMRSGMEARAEELLARASSAPEEPTVDGTLAALDGGLAGVPSDAALAVVRGWTATLRAADDASLYPILVDLQRLESILLGAVDASCGKGVMVRLGTNTALAGQPELGGRLIAAVADLDDPAAGVCAGAAGDE